MQERAARAGAWCRGRGRVGAGFVLLESAARAGAWWMASVSLPAVMKTGRYVQREKPAPCHWLKTSSCSSWLLIMSDWRMSSSTPELAFGLGLGLG